MMVIYVWSQKNKIHGTPNWKERERYITEEVEVGRIHRTEKKYLSISINEQGTLQDHINEKVKCYCDLLIGTERKATGSQRQVRMEHDKNSTGAI